MYSIIGSGDFPSKLAGTRYRMKNKYRVSPNSKFPTHIEMYRKAWKYMYGTRESCAHIHN